MAGETWCRICKRNKTEAIQEQLSKGECCGLMGCVFHQEISRALGITPNPEPYRPHITRPIRIEPIQPEPYRPQTPTTPEWLKPRSFIISIVLVSVMILFFFWSTNRLSVPQNLSYDSPGTDSVTIRWDNAGSDISYLVYISRQNDPSSAIPIGEPRTTTSINVAQLDSDTNYYFWVTSIKGERESNKSTVLTVRTAVSLQTPITTPVITINTHPITTKNVTAGNISGNLSVTASVTQGATLSYQWFRNTSNNNSGGTAISGATRASYTIPTNLSAGTYYYYVVVSATGGATSVRSNVSRVTVSAQTTQPSANASSLVGTSWEYINRNDNNNRYRLSFSSNNAVRFSIYNSNASRQLESYNGTFSLQGNTLTVTIIYPEGRETDRFTFTPQTSIINNDNRSIIYRQR